MKQHALKALETLVQISQFYGKDPAYVIAGGGNTSYKDADSLYIKASGIALATIDVNGFVQMSRELLRRMENKQYSENAAEREEQVKQDLKKAIIHPEHLRPSVETSLHNLFDYSYVVHTHPTLVNGVMCANDAAKFVEERFSSGALYVEYTDPGYILFKKIEERVKEYMDNHHRCPQIIFLQNHGIFVAADTTGEIKDLYDSIESAISEQKHVVLPAGESQEISSETTGIISDYFKERGLVTRAYKTTLSDHFTANPDQVEKISRPFTPDIIVYCKSRYLFLEKEWGRDVILAKIQDFEKQQGYYPKVILLEQSGICVTEESDRAVQTVFEVFHDMMKISYLSEEFGGPHCMTPEQIAFIDNWEVENYRRKVAKSG